MDHRDYGDENIQSPKRRETDEQAKERAQKIREKNEERGCDAHGNPVATVNGEPLKNLSKREWDVFKAFRR